MSTRSRIAVQREDGSFLSSYLHFDGYPAGAGAVLTAHYTDPATVAQLIALGDLSSLGPEIGAPHPFGAQDAAYATWCTAYGRDRGELGTAAKVSGCFTDLVALTAGCWGEFLYVFADGAWQGYAIGHDPACAQLLPPFSATAHEGDDHA